MFPQRGAPVEGFVTDVAAERLLSCVSPYVFCHVSFQLKTLAAEMAAVRPLSCVNSHVVLQVALTGDVFPADVTVEVAFAVLRLAFVRLEVPRQHRLFGEDVVAYMAAVQGGARLLFGEHLIVGGGLLRLSALLGCSTVL